MQNIEIENHDIVLMIYLNQFPALARGFKHYIQWHCTWVGWA